MFAEAADNSAVPTKVTNLITRARVAAEKTTKRKQRTSFTDSSSLIQEDPEVLEIVQPKHKRARVNRKRCQSSARDSMHGATSSSSSPSFSSVVNRS